MGGIATPEDIAANGETLGRPVPGVEVAVYDENRRRLGEGEHGELFIRGDMVFEGYASGEETKEIEGFLPIGDIGYFDEEGRLFVEGRGDDMVVIGGENVYPAEIEEVIDGIDGVDDVAVVGVKDEEYGEVLAAFVVGSVDPDTVTQTCERELASFKVPKRVEIVDELPRNATGKIVKKELAEEEPETPRSA
jgi:acyl-CoA synthetase (AMP-forming)/AMP-acid ligase II